MAQNKKVLVIYPHLANMVPGQRLKYEQYFAHWRENGFNVDISLFFLERMQQMLYKKDGLLKKSIGVIKAISKG